MTLSERIKEATKPAHQELEKLLLLKMKRISSLSGYVELLQLFHSFFGQLELMAMPFISPHLADFEQRRKVQGLEKDLNYFGACPLSPAAAIDLPEVKNFAQALGVMYVMEGSTLGGAVITDMLSRQLHADPGAGFSYFRGYGDQNMEMWKKFKEFLDSRNGSNDQDATVVCSADETFQRFRDLILRTG